jgi:hypothetical protein
MGCILKGFPKELLTGFFFLLLVPSVIISILFWILIPISEQPLPLIFLDPYV